MPIIKLWEKMYAVTWILKFCDSKEDAEKYIKESQKESILKTATTSMDIIMDGSEIYKPKKGYTKKVIYS